jgi:hypothetical protein
MCSSPYPEKGREQLKEMQTDGSNSVLTIKMATTDETRPEGTIIIGTDQIPPETPGILQSMKHNFVNTGMQELLISTRRNGSSR